MSHYIGDHAQDQTVEFHWNTNELGGASVNPSADGTFHVYKDAETGTEVTTGIANSKAHDGLVGSHHVTIVTTDSFYETGHDYFFVVKATTIDSEVVNACIRHFSIQNRHHGVLVQSSAESKKSAQGATVTHGTETLTYAATLSLDSSYHQIQAVLDTTYKIDTYYEFQIGGDGLPGAVTMTGYFDKGGGLPKDLTVNAWKWAGGGSWEQIGVLNSSVPDGPESFDLFERHKGTGGDLGLVRIQFVTGSVALTATSELHVDQIFIAHTIDPTGVGYALGAIWGDTRNGTAGTERRVNGVADNKSLTWADMQTLNGIVNLDHFRIANGSSITLDNDSSFFTIIGQKYDLALGGQDISDAYIAGADVTGISSGTGASFHECHVDTCDIPCFHFDECGMSGTILIVTAGDIFFDRCHSAVAGEETWTLDLNENLNASQVNVRHHSGGIKVKNFGVGTGDYKMTLEGEGQLIVDATCTGGTIVVRGHFTITDNSGGAVDINQDANFNQERIATAVWSVDPESYGVGTAGEALAFARAFIANKKIFTFTGATSGQLDVYDIAGSSILYSLQLQGVGGTGVGAVPV